MGATLEADIAIVGAGPAGITLALELIDRGHTVLLIESGGDSYKAGVQELGETVGHDPVHVPMSLATRRQIGGTSNLWAGRCVPFDPVDFQARTITGNATWPVSYEELERYFSRACAWCVCGEPTFDARQIRGLAERSLIPDGQMETFAQPRWSAGRCQPTLGACIATGWRTRRRPRSSAN